jgi:uncharacterized protein YbjT (DUF2867 family)
MKLLILGATGATGTVVVAQALRRGHEVTAFARHPGTLVEQPGSLRVIQGDVLDPQALVRAIPGHDAVLFCVGPGDTKASTLRATGARNTVLAMAGAGVRRLIAMSGLGAGVTRKNMGFVFDKVLAPTVLRGLLEDQNGLEAAIRKSGLDWIVVRPGEIIDSRPLGAREIAVSLDGSGVTTTIAREDVGRFMLDQLQSDEYLHKAAAIGY